MRAMVLAAGFGTRLGEITKHTPKCLVEVGGKAMLEHVVDRLKAAGVTSLVINLHYLPEKVRAYVEKRHNFGLEVIFSEEKKIRGTGGALQPVQKLFAQQDSFIMCNADIYCEFDFAHAVKEHKKSGALATLLSMQRTDTSYLLWSADNKLCGWEKEGSPAHTIAATSTNLIRKAFCGIQILSPHIYQFFPPHKDEFSIIECYMAAIEQQKVIRSVDIGTAYWVDIGTPATLALLKNRLEQKSQ